MAFSTEVIDAWAIGNDVADTFPFGFRIQSRLQLHVFVISVSGASRLLVLDVDYDVLGVGEDDGAVVLKAGPLAEGLRILTLRHIPKITQEASFRNEHDFYADRHEDAYDLCRMIDLQLARGLRGAIRLPEYEDPDAFDLELAPASVRAGTVPVFDLDGKLAYGTLPDGLTVTINPLVVEGARIIRRTGLDGASDLEVDSDGVDVPLATVKTNDNGVADLGLDATVLTARTAGPFAIDGRVLWKAGTGGTYHRLDLVNVDTGEVLDSDARNDMVSNSIARALHVSANVYLLVAQRVRLVAYTDAVDDGRFIDFASLAMYYQGGGGVASSAVGVPVGPAGGDLGGNYPTPTVVGRQGTALPTPSASMFTKRNAADTGWEDVPYGQVANTVAEGNDDGFPRNLLTTKGDLIGRSGAAPVRLPVGQRDRALIANPEAAAGVSYADKSWIYDKYRREAYLQTSQNLGLLYVGWANSTTLGASTFDPDADGGWAKYTTTTSLNSSIGHPLTEGNGILTRTQLLPACWVKYKTGPLSTDIQSVRTWLAFIKDIGSIATTSNPVSSIFAMRFDTSQGDTNWMIYTCDGSTAVVTDSGVPVAADTAYRFGFVFTSTANLLVYVNDVLVATLTTHLPVATDSIVWNYYLTNLQAGTARSGKFEKLVCSQE